MSLTKLSTDSLELERQIQRFLVMQCPLLVGVAQALLDQAQVNARVRRCFDRIKGLAHPPKIDPLAPEAQPPTPWSKKTGW